MAVTKVAPQATNTTDYRECEAFVNVGVCAGKVPMSKERLKLLIDQFYGDGVLDVKGLVTALTEDNRRGLRSSIALHADGERSNKQSQVMSAPAAHNATVLMLGTIRNVAESANQSEAVVDF